MSPAHCTLIQETFNAVAREADKVAREHGFHLEDEDTFVLKTCNNMHAEITELHDAWRAGALRSVCDKAPKMLQAGLPALTCVEEELADIILRALGTAQKLKVDIGRAIAIKHDFNKSRPFGHGNKKS